MGQFVVQAVVILVECIGNDAVLALKPLAVVLDVVGEEFPGMASGNFHANGSLDWLLPVLSEVGLVGLTL